MCSEVGESGRGEGREGRGEGEGERDRRALRGRERERKEVVGGHLGKEGRYDEGKRLVFRFNLENSGNMYSESRRGRGPVERSEKGGKK